MTWKIVRNGVAVAVIGGAVSACAVDTPLSVEPGQGKSYSDLQRDDAACRAGPAPATTAPQQAATVPGNYYQCMQSRGELVVANRPVPYPVYAGYPYAYPYGYGYGYPYLGYPYPAAYVGPFVGVGFGFGRGYYHGGYYRGYYGHGFYRH